MFDLNDIVEMKKPHACGANRWQIIRVGADIKIQCTQCQHIVMMSRRDFTRKMKKVLEKAADSE
ncbi:DUF951 domain-containing protein [Loigolactobacillus coryniformis]|uniref:DUF951 domain-containing protein n=3 Tax=Loigolactobacillus coryniformis TaxID=1610 RepID=A0A0R1FBN5_9LACO|nr:DUF951 domain-containing protein [Loigolactobacillus coryniformis]MDT3392441.1 DUF951 domain-containing protein [Bacillota bacterium]OEH90718.1 hypothetical protein ATO00_02230 [Loigolactobacillus coryniformis subsp. coryniformis]RRG03469.1 MAG: DUF951 domain-containing protein [Lactobacillus sp.]ATO42658.1 DUF951 domain-containing protein [Loigolactobacillus coryniformis subsp. torquens DSM 20004 = KCTC 3535]ATO54350.1 DUF951 domain-containing protein [Loigolactobacillus coryniformis subsp